MTSLKFRNDDKVKTKVFILDSIESIEKTGLCNEEAEYVKKCYEDSKDSIITINRYSECYYIFFIDSEVDESKFMETCRRRGASLCKLLNKSKYEE